MHLLNKLVMLKIITYFILLTATPAGTIDKKELQKAIDKCPYIVEDYKDNEFDCSNMAAMLGDWLDIYGYNVTYQVGCKKKGCHIWLIINEEIYIESTAKSIVTKRTYRYYKICATNNDYHKLPAKQSEFDYSKKIKEVK